MIRIQPSICEGVQFPCNRSHFENIRSSIIAALRALQFDSPFARFTSTSKALSNTNTNSHCCGDKSPKQQPIKPTVSPGNRAVIATNYSKQEMFGLYYQFDFFGDPVVVLFWRSFSGEHLKLWSCASVSCRLRSERKLDFQLLLLQHISLFCFTMLTCSVSY